MPECRPQRCREDQALPWQADIAVGAGGQQREWGDWCEQHPESREEVLPGQPWETGEESEAHTQRTSADAGPGRTSGVAAARLAGVSGTDNSPGLLRKVGYFRELVEITLLWGDKNAPARTLLRDVWI